MKWQMWFAIFVAGIMMAGISPANVNAAVDDSYSNQFPHADFTYKPATPGTYETIIFDASACYDPDGYIVSYKWDWNDDGVYDTTGKTASHTWNRAGNYTIRLKVTDDKGASTIKWKTISVIIAPKAGFSYAPANPTAGETVQFYDESIIGESSSSGENIQPSSVNYDVEYQNAVFITSWHWDFGDGTTSNERNPVHTYENAGEYRVTLTVTTNNGKSSSVTKTINVEKMRVVLKVAILRGMEEPPIAAQQIKRILNFSWSTKNKIYQFSCDILSYAEVRNGNLNTGSYKAFIIPGIPIQYVAGVCPTFSALTGFKKEVRKFVDNGGGYFGICGGAVAASSGIENPDTWLEVLADRAALGLIPAKIKQDFSDPITASLLGHPEKVGQTAYLFYNESDALYDESNAFGVTVTLDNIDTSHPLFKNLDLSSIPTESYDGEHLRIRWWGGPGFLGNGIACYRDEISQMDNTKLHVWKFVGNWSKTNVPNCVFTNYSNPTDNDLLDYLGWIKNMDWTKWEDYNQTDVYVKTYLQDTAAIASAIYDKNGDGIGGKVLAFGPHPEDSIWDGGYIVESKDTPHNSLYRGLFRWEGYYNINEYADHWLIIRGVAWVSGAPESELPYTNHPPDKPVLLYPENNETAVSIDVTLRWQCSDPDGDKLVYNVYIREKGSSTWQVVSRIKTNYYKPGNLEYATTYEWYIVAVDEQGLKAKSNVWQFTTELHVSQGNEQLPSSSLSKNGYATVVA